MKEQPRSAKELSDDYAEFYRRFKAVSVGSENVEARVAIAYEVVAWAEANGLNIVTLEPIHTEWRKP